jgi:hypothetical protein
VRSRGAIALCLAVLALASPARAQSDRPDERGSSRECNALTATRERGGVKLVAFNQLRAITHPRRYGRNTALWTAVRGVRCRTVWGLMGRVLIARDELVALEAAGWRAAEVERLRIDGVALHQVWAVRGRKRIVYVRRGARAPVSPSVYRAGQALGFHRSRAGCTSAFALRLPFTRRLVGLTAGHCSGYPRSVPPGGTQTEDAVRVLRSRRGRRKRVLGPLLANTAPREGGPDALLFGVGGVSYAAQQVQRGRRRPVRVTGWLSTGKQRRGRVVCYYGQVSGEHCGKIAFKVPLIAEELICARLERNVRPGDSGGPVYTRPRGRRTRAVGVVKGSIDLTGPFYTAELCYTPIERVLRTFGTEFPRGSFRPRR